MSTLSIYLHITPLCYDHLIWIVDHSPGGNTIFDAHVVRYFPPWMPSKSAHLEAEVQLIESDLALVHRGVDQKSKRAHEAT